jgi:hypothetical protein
MVTLVINCRNQRRCTNCAAGCGDAPLQGLRRHPARGDSDEPDAVRPMLKSSEEAPGIRGRSTRPEKALTEDWAGGGASMGAGTRHATARDRGGTDSERVRDDSFDKSVGC